MSIRNEVEELCREYGFRVVDASEDPTSLLSRDKSGNLMDFIIQGKDIDGQWASWISYSDSSPDDTVYVMNTDTNNMWLYETRPDLTPGAIAAFTAKLAGLLDASDLKVSDIVDPEDWQEIAGVTDAYGDERYARDALSF